MSRRRVWRAVAALVAGAAAAVLLGGCAGGGGQDGFTVGVLLPVTGGTGRFALFDKPLIEQRLHQLCPQCQVEIVSAMDDAATQEQQINTMITDKVKVMILAAVAPLTLRSAVTSAHQAGIPVVAYDRLAEGPIAGYVTYDGTQVGRLQGEGLLQGMGGAVRGGRIIMMNGDSSDPNSALFTRGALSVLAGRVEIARSYSTLNWQQANAYANMTGAIAALGANGIDGVLAANDNLATGVVNAIEAAHISPLPPVTGQDADLDAVRRIVGGRQYMTVYKPFRPEAYAAADMAVALMRGRSLAGIARTAVDNSTTRHIPAVLLTPTAVSLGDIKSTIVKDGMYTISEICTPDLRPACVKAGLL